jgi:hypothetical protein
MQRLILIAKWAWITVLVVGAGWYISQNFSDVAAELGNISPLRILASLSLLFTGRLLIIQLARSAVSAVGQQQAYNRMLHKVALSELGKYLPGGIWHFVGRTGYYRADGLSITQATRAIFTEHLWLAVSSALGGSILLLNYRPNTFHVLGAITLLSLWVLFIILTLRRTTLTTKVTTILYLLLLQVAIWLSLGMSYVVLLPLRSLDELALTVGAFAISWLFGFVVILAPGGIGIREAALTTLMLPLFAAQTTLILASVHRLLWVGVELLLGLIALLSHNSQRHPSTHE